MISISSVVSIVVTLLMGAKSLLIRKRHTYKVSSVSRIAKPSVPSKSTYLGRIWKPNPPIVLSTRQSVTATKQTPVRMNVVIDPKMLSVKVLMSASDGMTPARLPLMVVSLISLVICMFVINQVSNV